MVFGKRYEHSDIEFKELLKILNESVEKMGSGGAVLFVPIMRHIFPKQYNELVSSLMKFTSFVKKIVNEHEQAFDKSNMHDIIDVFLNEIEVAAKENTDRKDFVTSKSVTSTAIWLFLAGTETSTTVLRWMILYMITYREVQVKVQEEIDAVVGRRRLPQWTDRLNLPYTEAVLLEIQRITTIVPLTFPHVASEDTTLAGYDVPKDSFVVANMWAVHNDPDIWDEPDQFRPERFLDASGKLLHRKEFIPFSAGPCTFYFI